MIHFNLLFFSALCLLLTVVRTEAPFLVIIIAVSGAAPQLAISSSLTCAWVILLTQEHKGEVAGISLRISTNYSYIWINRDITAAVKQK